MQGIFEVVNAGVISKTYDGKTNNTIGCLQPGSAELVQVKIPDDKLLGICQGLELYKQVKMRLDVTKGQFNGTTYVNYKLLEVLK